MRKKQITVPPLQVSPYSQNVSRHSLITLLYVALVALSVIITVFHFVVDYHQTRRELEEKVEAYSLSMATDIRWYVDVVEQTLARVSEHLESVRAGATESSLFAQSLGELPDGVVVAVYDETGSSVVFLGQTSNPVSVSDRQYFQDIRAGEQLVFSSLISDRVTGNMTFAIGVPLVEDGVFRGAAVAYAPMETFSRSWLGVGGTGSNAFVVHRTRGISARLPAVESAAYEMPFDREFVETFFVSERGRYWAPVSPIDGVARVLGYSVVPNTPLSAVIGLDPNEAFSGYWNRLLITFAILLSILAVLGLFARKVRRLIIELEDSAAALARSNERNNTLLLEIHHRVKNNLQSALALFRLHVKDKQIVADIEPRINAMVAAHEHIYNSDALGAVSANSYITYLARKTLFAVSKDIDLTTSIPEVPLDDKVLMPLGQLINEVVINAAKYGYPDGRHGVVDIRLTVDSDEVATLTIHNDGDPIPHMVSRGLGSRLISAFAGQLCGEVTTFSDSSGVTVTLKFPLSRDPSNQ